MRKSPCSSCLLNEGSHVVNDVTDFERVESTRLRHVREQGGHNLEFNSAFVISADLQLEIEIKPLQHFGFDDSYEKNVQDFGTHALQAERHDLKSAETAGHSA